MFKRAIDWLMGRTPAKATPVIGLMQVEDKPGVWQQAGGFDSHFYSREHERNTRKLMTPVKFGDLGVGRRFYHAAADSIYNKMDAETGRGAFDGSDDGMVVAFNAETEVWVDK